MLCYGPMVRRLRRRAIIKSTLVQRLALTGKSLHCIRNETLRVLDVCRQREEKLTPGSVTGCSCSH